jgi:hypothetical protein
VLPLALALSLALQASTDWDGDEPRWDAPVERHLELGVWGGSSLDLQRGGGFAPWAGAELGWRFTESAVSLLFEGHRYGTDRADRAWTPVILARVEQRFETLRGLQGTFAFGAGAGRSSFAPSWASSARATCGSAPAPGWPSRTRQRRTARRSAAPPRGGCAPGRRH